MKKPMIKLHLLNPHTTSVTSYLILTLLVILLITLIPNHASRSNQVGHVKLVPLYHVTKLADIAAQANQPLSKTGTILIDILGNIAMFVPFGILASLLLKQERQSAWKRGLLVFSAGLLFSLSIEIIQFWLPTRTSDIDDVIFNTGGTLLGVILTSVFSTIGR